MMLAIHEISASTVAQFTCTRSTNNFLDAYLLKYVSKKRVDKMVRKASTIAEPAVEEVQEYKRPTWAEFELGQAPVYWRTFNGLPPTSGLTEELSKDGACDKAIFPEANTVVSRCAMIGNLSAVGGDRCNLDLVPGCTDPSSPDFNPLANVSTFPAGASRSTDQMGRTECEKTQCQLENRPNPADEVVNVVS
ncbi:hypothetical protein ACLOJK_040303 [Asimina triloba]